LDRTTLLNMLTPRLLESYEIDASDSAAMQAAVEKLNAAVVAESELTETGFDRIASYVRTQLNRLSVLAADRKRYPQISRVAISTPIFLTGAARSGTTFLHSLLSQDPQHRSPLTWEVEFPSPPPEGAHLEDDPRIGQWVQLQSGPDAVHSKNLNNREMQKKHLIGATLPEECGGMLGAMLRNPTATWTFARLLPYFHWVIDTQMTQAYQLHHRWLQQLQWRARRSYWLMKYPMHIFALPQLTQIYPNALLIQTHRDPNETVSSLASLLQTHRLGALRNADSAELGREMLEINAVGLERGMAYRSRADARPAVDVSYRQMIADPIATVRTVYDSLGISLSGEAEKRMRTFIAANPQGKQGEHVHRLGNYGLQEADVSSRMRDYIERYGALL
jgi:hypothetical protein